MTKSTKAEYPTEEQICAIYGHQIIWEIRPDFRQRWEASDRTTAAIRTLRD